MALRPAATPQVSSLGRYRSATGVVTVPKLARDGYAYVRVYGRRLLVSRLVALAFRLPRPRDATQVDHINGVCGDNRRSNLRWVSRSQNILHSYRTNPRRRSAVEQRAHPVLGRAAGRRHPGRWRRYASSTEAARRLGLDARSVRAAAAGGRRIEGYEFRRDVAREPSELTDEEWRCVPGSRTWVSSLGRVRNSFGVTITPRPRADGYAKVAIGGRKHAVHRLVAEAFALPHPAGADQVDHVNGIRHDNRRENLQWVSASENVRLSYATNAARGTCARRLSKPVRARPHRTDDGPGVDDEWVWYPSGAEAARALGVRHSGKVSDCCNGVRRHVNGHVFVWATPHEPTTLRGEEWRDVIVRGAGCDGDA